MINQKNKFFRGVMNMQLNEKQLAFIDQWIKNKFKYTLRLWDIKGI